MNKATGLILIAAIVSGIAGYWLSSTMQDKEATQAVDAVNNQAQANLAASSDNKLPNFAFELVRGGTIANQDLLGQAHLVNLWATWCAPCRREMPALMALHEEIKDEGAAVLGVAMDDPQEVREFIENLGIEYPNALAPGMPGTRFARDLGNGNGLLPFTVFVDANGNIADVHFGELKIEDARRKMRALML